MGASETYAATIETYKRIGRIGQVLGVLHWDQQVIMPKKGLDARSEQLALLSGEIHKQATAPEFVGRVNELAANLGALPEDARVNVREIKRETDKRVKVPQDLVEEISRHTAKSHAIWAEARANKDFAAFAPALARMVELKIAEAKAKGDPGQSPYDVMLDDFEVGLDEKSAAAVLDDLRARLVPFIQKVLAAKRPDIPALAGRRYPIDAQRAFGLKIMADLGFDFDGGRQDISVHPFCTGELGDVRITTRFFEDDPRPSLFGMIHETGHALYEQGTDPAHVLTPMGFSLSLGIHESQSRLWENLVGRSLPFWKAYYADLQAAFPEALSGVPLAGFHRFINQVEGSLIRVEADEATYNLHVVLRFEIERDLIAGRVAVKDLPAVWNAKMKSYLGVDVPDDAVGVLQDVHWSEGLIGYFPTYSLGNLYGAQLFEAARRAVPDLDARIERRDFAPLLAWLRENVHRHGKRFSPQELIARATGKAPTAEPFLAYMEQKYGEIYNL